GTVSNKQGDLWGSSIEHGGVGYCCLAELRTYETIEQGEPATPFMGDGDTVRIEMFDAAGKSIFGTIENRVVALKA
ncbi:2-keto-4-pentenoate hydratase, partial [Thauera aromatica]|nr:2-keto-4-pentenoate hydratase [Thauera aromatica]